MQHGPARARSGDPLRDDFFRLFLRSYQAAEKSGAGLDVYRSSAKFIHRLLAERWARDTMFPSELALVRRFLRETGLPGDPDAVAQLSLMANPWAATWTEALQKLDRASFGSLCRVDGEDILRATLGAGRGAVCAHYHTLFAPLFWTWLEHAGIAPGVLIREWSKAPGAAGAKDAKARAVGGARELKAAVDTLRAGGAVHVMADGYEGNRKQSLPFCRRQRGFETTFIELALMTGAPILTISVNFSGSGQLDIEIGPALADDPTAPRAARTDQLLRQYVAHLHRRWERFPADISWFQMNRHLGLPRQ